MLLFDKYFVYRPHIRNTRKKVKANAHKRITLTNYLTIISWPYSAKPCPYTVPIIRQIYINPYLLQERIPELSVQRHPVHASLSCAFSNNISLFLVYDKLLRHSSKPIRLLSEYHWPFLQTILPLSFCLQSWKVTMTLKIEYCFCQWSRVQRDFW